MKRYFKILLIVVAMLAANSFPSKANVKFENEVLNYQIVYHWGLVWKHAASASLTLKNNGSNYDMALYARTISWADKIYRVRDTLHTSVSKDGFRPLKYVKSAHEGKSFGTDVVEFSYPGGNNTSANCKVYREKKPVQNVKLSTTGQAYDMLSVFYYLRTMNFESLQKSKIYRSIIFSGRKKENLDIKYIGVEMIKLRDKSQHKAYHIKFSFTQDGKTKSSDDIDAWLSVENTHIPLMIIGHLPIGEVRVYYAAK